MNPTITSCWSPSSEQVNVESAGNDEKHQLFGSVDYRTGDIIFSDQQRKRTSEYISHLEQILAKYPDRPIILITDNYQIHKTKAVKELERRHFGRLLQVYLPTYSPHLNPIEMLWRHVRRLVTHNYKFDTIAAVIEAVRRVLEQLSKHADQVLSIIGGKPLAKAEAT